MIRQLMGIAIFFCLALFPSYAGFPWSSTELSGIARTHQFLTRAAYSYLQKHPMIAQKLINFPSLPEIENYEGVNVNLTNNLQIIGKGPDNPENSHYDDHVFNPALPNGGAGNGPEKISEYYLKLKESLIHSSPENIPAKNAAYLAHFIQDMCCPFHVIGSPLVSGNYDPLSSGPYIGKYKTGLWEIPPPVDLNEICSSPMKLARQKFKFTELLPSEFWLLMVDRYNQDKHPGKNWFDPNYYDGPICSKYYTYLSTHFLYEALVAPYHNNPDIIDYFNSLSDINKFGETWNKLPNSAVNRASEFARLMAGKTRSCLDQNLEELMFDPHKMMELEELPFNLLAATDVGKGTVLNSLTVDKVKGYVPMPKQMWRMAVQSTYTLWRATFSALYVDLHKDILLLMTGIKPYKYIVKIRARNYEQADNAENVKIKLKSKKQGTGYFDEVTIGTINGQGTSEWFTFKNALESDDISELEISGKYTTTSDAGMVSFSPKGLELDPIGGTWHIEEADANVIILYDPLKKYYDCKIVAKGDFLFHMPGDILVGGLRPALPDISPAENTNDISYKGFEMSWDMVKTSDGKKMKGKSTTIPATLTLTGNGNLIYKTADDTFHFSRVDL
jgi:hypothetical protein